MKAGWRLVPLGEVCMVVNGGTPKSNVASYWGGEVNWLTPKDMGKMTGRHIAETPRKITSKGLDNCSARLVPPGSVIMSTRAPIGHLAINDAPMAFNQGCRGMIPEANLDPVFLFHFLSASIEALSDLGTGTTFKELSATALRGFPIPLPPLDDQKRIVAVLDKAFEGLSRARANAEANLSDARDLFDELCDSAVAMDCKMYGTVALSAMASEITDGDHMPPPKAKAGIPFVTISNICRDTRRLDFSDTFLVPNEYYEGLKQNKKPVAGDLLYTVTGATLGIPVLVDSYPDFCFQRHIGLIRPLPAVRPLWLYYVLMSNYVFRQATSGATGTAQKTVSLKVLRSIQVPKAPPERQKQLAAKLSDAWNETIRVKGVYAEKLSELETLRQALLQKAFSGELT